MKNILPIACLLFLQNGFSELDSINTTMFNIAESSNTTLIVIEGNNITTITDLDISNIGSYILNKIKRIFQLNYVDPSDVDRENQYTVTSNTTETSPGVDGTSSSTIKRYPRHPKYVDINETVSGNSSHMDFSTTAHHLNTSVYSTETEKFNTPTKRRNREPKNLYIDGELLTTSNDTIGDLYSNSTPVINITKHSDILTTVSPSSANLALTLSVFLNYVVIALMIVS
ncbi:uncharacterized protein LOC143251536 [Tachypleus tridentatus]|uniref:uncharacterized protein LOC143251536 n=1 Tax=Tachypleus tridentatus TaxID=6853 RepID=UPI003FD5C50E